MLQNCRDVPRNLTLSIQPVNPCLNYGNKRVSRARASRDVSLLVICARPQRLLLPICSRAKSKYQPYSL
jgi:hypothetical protein